MRYFLPLLCAACMVAGPVPVQANDMLPQAARKPAKPVRKPAGPDLRKLKPRPLKKPLPSTK